MKRRDFIKASGLLFGGLSVIEESHAKPCSPSGLTIDGETKGSTTGNCPLSTGQGPAWVDSLTVNQWTPLSNANTFRDVWPPDSGQYGNTGPQSVMIAWCGASFASGFGSFGSLIHWGGGHQDYYGNEVYAFDLETLTWRRLNDTSPHATASNISAGLPNGLYPDGTPGVPHTYASVVYRSRANEFITTRRELNNLGGYTDTTVSRFSLENLEWRNHTDVMNPSSRWNLCVYDSKRDSIWAINTDHASSLSWSRFDFSSGVWTNFSQPTGVILGSAAVYVPSKDCIVFWAGNLSAPVALDPQNPTADKVQLTVSGDTFATSSSSDDSAIWSNNLNGIIYYPSRSSNIYLIRAPQNDWRDDTWEVSRIGVTGSSGEHSGSNGTFGKFQVAEWGSATVCLLNSNVDGPCYAVRLT